MNVSLTREFQHVLRADDVGGLVGHRIGDGWSDAGLGGEVDDGVVRVIEPVKRALITDIGFDEFVLIVGQMVGDVGYVGVIAACRSVAEDGDRGVLGMKSGELVDRKIRALPRAVDREES